MVARGAFWRLLAWLAGSGEKPRTITMTIRITITIHEHEHEHEYDNDYESLTEAAEVSKFV
jgi:hypothetical protein